MMHGSTKLKTTMCVTSVMEVKLQAFLTFNMNINVTSRPFHHEVNEVTVPTGQEAPAEYGNRTLVPVGKLAEFLVLLRAAKNLFKCSVDNT
jgi:hypothetical protein